MLICNPLWFSGVPSGPGYALFAGGLNPSTSVVTSATAKYAFVSNTYTAGTNLPNQTSSIGEIYNMAAAGSKSIGVFGGGWSTGTSSAPAPYAGTNRYTYTTDVSATGGALGAAQTLLAATGDALVGLFFGGIGNSGAQIKTDNIYNYAGNTSISGAASGAPATDSQAAISNATVAIFAGGNLSGVPTATTWQHNYNNFTQVAGTALAVAVSRPQAFSSKGLGIIAGGQGASAVVANVNVYTFSGNVVTAGAALATTRTFGFGTANGTTGIIVGGSDTSGNHLSDTLLWALSNSAVTSGVSLSAPWQQGAATASSPGNF